MNATACGAQHAFPAPRRTPTRPAVRAAKGKISGSAGTSRKRPSVQRCCRAPCQKDARGAAIGRAACDPRFAASFRACLSSRGLRASSRLRLDCAGRPVSPDAPRYIPNLPLVVSPNWPPSSASCIPRSPASRCLGRRSSASATLPTVIIFPTYGPALFPRRIAVVLRARVRRRPPSQKRLVVQAERSPLSALRFPAPVVPARCCRPRSTIAGGCAARRRPLRRYRAPRRRNPRFPDQPKQCRTTRVRLFPILVRQK